MKDYISFVLLPEALTYIFMEFFDLSMEEAQKHLFAIAASCDDDTDDEWFYFDGFLFRKVLLHYILTFLYLTYVWFLNPMYITQYCLQFARTSRFELLITFMYSTISWLLLDVEFWFVYYLCITLLPEIISFESHN